MNLEIEEFEGYPVHCDDLASSLGSLGRLSWWRCRGCGLEFSTEAPGLPLAEANERYFPIAPDTDGLHSAAEIAYMEGAKANYAKENK